MPDVRETVLLGSRPCPQLGLRRRLPKLPRLRRSAPVGPVLARTFKQKQIDQDVQGKPYENQLRKRKADRSDQQATEPVARGHGTKRTGSMPTSAHYKGKGGKASQS